MIYPMSMLPDWLRPIVGLNPITNILIMFRDVMLNNSLLEMKALVLAIIEAVLALIIGLWVFYKNQDDFILNI